MKISRIVEALEQIAPPSLSASWDNVGLLVGDRHAAATTLLLCIDLTPPVLAEARRASASMVMAYHPVIFKGLSRLTAQATPVVYQAARAGVAVYSMHTALDAAPGGVNDALGDLLGLTDRRPLELARGEPQCKIVVFVPAEDMDRVASAAFDAGAGHIGRYDHCSFSAAGVGTFRPLPGSHPAIGQLGRREHTPELRLELIAPCTQTQQVVDAIRAAHRYEEPGIDVYPLEPTRPVGMGRVGPLRRAASVDTLVARIKKALGLRGLWLARAQGANRPVRVAAVSAGSAGEMHKAAARAGATFYLTGEMRHHDALSAVGAGLTVACVGHSNSERLALPILARQIRTLLPDLNVIVSKADRDPFELA